MRRIATTLAVVGALLFSAGSAWADFDDDDSGANKLFVADAALPVSAHEFRFETIGGEPLPLAQYAGKVVLVVKTAMELPQISSCPGWPARRLVLDYDRTDVRQGYPGDQTTARRTGR
jgi:hypothetical protein